MSSRRRLGMTAMLFLVEIGAADGRLVAGDRLLHVDRVEILDHVVVEALRIVRHRVGYLAAERAHVYCEALSKGRVHRQPGEVLDLLTRGGGIPVATLRRL